MALYPNVPSITGTSMFLFSKEILIFFELIHKLYLLSDLAL